MAGERDRLLADPLHEAAVAGDDISAVVDDVGAIARREQSFRDGHADGRGEPLSERPRGRFDAWRMAVFRMARRPRIELAEALQFVPAHVRIAKQMQQRIEQHRTMSGGQHETVAVGPGRIGGIELHEAA